MSSDDTTAESPAPAMAMSDLLRREWPGDELGQAHRPTGVYPVLAVATGILLLASSIVTSAIALSSAPTERAAPVAAATAITGADALRPDVINSSFGTATRTIAPGVPAPPGADRTRPDTPAPPAGTAGAAAAPATPQAGAAAAPPAPGAGNPGVGDTPPDETGPVLETVLAFYRNATAAPQEAFSLLAPPLRSAGYDEFRMAWADVERVSVDQIRLDSPDTAAVTLTIARTDGNVLRSLQLVRVMPGTQPHIVDARLLSASRS